MKSTTMTAEPSLKEMSAFLSDYADLLFGCGSTCIRLEKNVSRIASAADMDAVMSILPHHIHLTLCDRHSQESITSIISIHERAASFDINTRLSRLSWALSDRLITFAGAQEELQQISRTPPVGKGTVLILASLANAAFCRLFGGDPTAMAIVFTATMAGFYIKQVLTERKVDIRLTFMICSFISAVLASSDGLFGLGSTPATSVGTSVLYLVPGIPFINSFCDMIDRHYICAFGRMMNAIVLTCCLSAGLCAGMLLMNIGMF